MPPLAASADLEGCSQGACIADGLAEGQAFCCYLKQLVQSYWTAYHYVLDGKPSWAGAGLHTLEPSQGHRGSPGKGDAVPGVVVPTGVGLSICCVCPISLSRH